MGGALAGNSTVPGDFATIQAAINDAGTGAGDTITVDVTGTHQESTIHITKSVTIQGLGIGTTTVASPSSQSGKSSTAFTFRETRPLSIRHSRIMAVRCLQEPTVDPVMVGSDRTRWRYPVTIFFKPMLGRASGFTLPVWHLKNLWVGLPSMSKKIGGGRATPGMSQA